MNIEFGSIAITLSLSGLFTGLGLCLKKLRKKHQRKSKFRQEYADIANDARGSLWRAVQEAYQRFKKQEVEQAVPNDLEKLLSDVGMPPDIGGRKGRDLLDWPKEHSAQLDTKQQLLWKFAQLIYPPRGERIGDVTEHTFISNPMAQDFHKARGKLAHFWDRALMDMSLSYFVKHHRAAVHDLILLSWLDIALKQWTGDPDEGKVNMFKIGNAITKERMSANKSS